VLLIYPLYNTRGGCLSTTRDVGGEWRVGGFVSGENSKELGGSEPLLLMGCCEPTNGCPALRFRVDVTATFGMGRGGSALEFQD